MPLNNQALSHQTTIYDLLQALKDTINYNMNCVKVATVLSFDPEKLTVKCRVNNKRLRQLKKDGNQILEDYPDIFAKVHFFGWGEIGSIYPIEPGMEGLLLFNDRELQTWYLTGEGGKLAYDRCHDLSDALFICGLHSQPNIPLVPFIEACLHIYYKGSDVQIKDNSITTNTGFNTNNCKQDFVVNSIVTKNNSSSSVFITSPDVSVEGNLHASTGVSGVVLAGSNLLTFVDGILTSIA